MHICRPEELIGFLSLNSGPDWSFVSEHAAALERIFSADWSLDSEHSPEHILELAAALEREPDPEPVFSMVLWCFVCGRFWWVS